MKITKYLKPSLVHTEMPQKDKRGVLEFLVSALVDQGQIPKEHVPEIITALLEREALTSTGLGYGVALPHAKTDRVSSIVIAFGRSTKGIDFEALDGNPVHFFFLILAPTKNTEEYLKTLSSISALMKDEKIRSRLSRAKSAGEIFAVLDQSP